MSLNEEIEIKCPKCEEKQQTTIWESLNADIDPEAKEELFKGQINVFWCQKCQFKSFLPVSLLYHDMTRKFMVQYFPVEFFDNNNFFNQFLEDGSFKNVSNDKIERIDYLQQRQIVFDMCGLVGYILFREKLFEKFSNKSKIEK